MVGLLDIAPSTRTIRVNGADVSVYGVSAKGIAALLTAFPNLKNLFMGGELKFDAASITEVAPDAVSAIIAAGCGYPGDTKATEIAATLPVGSQVELLGAIVELTMPQGIGPFVDALNATLDKMNFENRGKDPASKSQ